MFWLDRVCEQAREALKEKIASGETLLIRDEKTASGRVHVGSMRALALHAAIAERLDEAGVKNVFKFEINDFDPMDGLPVYLDEKAYRQHMGKPLYKIPSPEAGAPNFAEYFAQEYIGAIHDAGFTPEFYRSSELYLSGKMNAAIRLALEKADRVRKIYKEVSGAEKTDDWHPLNVICENCGKIGTTKVTAFDGEKVTYTCYPTAVKWAEGCGHSGTISPFDGRAKLTWKVEWPAKWFTLGVDIEGGGKDHFSKGGARDVARRVSVEVFGYPEPFGVPNEFFLIGGKKMSSSKGQGSSAKDIVDLIPPRIFRLALFQKEINQQINFDPAGDTIPLLFDAYDKLAEKYWSGVEDDDTRLFLYAHTPEERKNIKKRFLPRFSSVVFLQQMSHLDFVQEIAKLKGELLTEDDKEELELRAKYADKWLSTYAPEEYQYKIQETLPAGAKPLSELQRQAYEEILTYLKGNTEAPLDSQELHTLLHEVRKKYDLKPDDFFGGIYMAFLGKRSGPKMGWFLSVLGRPALINRLIDLLS